MDKQKLLQALFRLQNTLGANTAINSIKRAVYLSKLEALEHTYRGLEIPERAAVLLHSLEKKCYQIIAELEIVGPLKEKTGKLEQLLRFLKASVYDFTGELGGIKKYTNLYITTAALFMVLTPQFYGYMLPVIFVIPIFSGLGGMKRRNRTGFLMTLALIPAALMTSITWLRYIFQVALPAYEHTTAETALMWQVSPQFAQLLIIVPGLLSGALAAVSMAAAFYGFKYRAMFV